MIEGRSGYLVYAGCFEKIPENQGVFLGEEGGVAERILTSARAMADDLAERRRSYMKERRLKNISNPYLVISPYDAQDQWAVHFCELDTTSLRVKVLDVEGNGLSIEFTVYDGGSGIRLSWAVSRLVWDELSVEDQLWLSQKAVLDMTHRDLSKAKRDLENARAAVSRARKNFRKLPLPDWAKKVICSDESG